VLVGGLAEHRTLWQLNDAARMSFEDSAGSPVFKMTPASVFSAGSRVQGDAGVRVQLGALAARSSGASSHGSKCVDRPEAVLSERLG